MVDVSFPCQTKETLKKFLPSMISKLGKLRSLARDLKKNYTGAATNEFPGLAYFRHILLLVFTVIPNFGVETACPNPSIRSY